MTENNDELISLNLVDQERYLLRCGLLGWGGPATLTESIAVEMGWAGIEHFFASNNVLVSAIESKKPLSRIDWKRIFVSTEMFITSPSGARSDWGSVTGLREEETIALLNSVRVKIGEL